MTMPDAAFQGLLAFFTVVGGIPVCHCPLPSKYAERMSTPEHCATVALCRPLLFHSDTGTGNPAENVSTAMQLSAQAHTGEPRKP